MNFLLLNDENVIITLINLLLHKILKILIKLFNNYKIIVCK